MTGYSVMEINKLGLLSRGQHMKIKHIAKVVLVWNELLKMVKGNTGKLQTKLKRNGMYLYIYIFFFSM